MPFTSNKQLRFMFAKHPRIAAKMAKDAKRAHKPVVQRKKKKG